MKTNPKLRFIWLLTLLFTMSLSSWGATIGFDEYTIAPGETKTLTLSIKSGSINFVGFQANIETPGDLTVTNIAFAPNFAGKDDYTITSNLTDTNKAAFIVFAKDIKNVPKDLTGPFLSVTVHLDEDASPHGNLIHLADIKASDAEGGSASGEIVNGEWVGSIVIPVTSITLSETTWGCEVGDTYELSATVNPDNATDKTVVWSSDNTSVATVDADGTVTAVGIGTAKITVTSKAYPKISATCEFKVVAKEIPVTGITISEAACTMRVGGSKALSAAVQPADATNKAVEWSSSDQTVATVDASGVVAAVKEGTATITVKSAENPDIAASCVVTVEKTPVTSITIEPATWEGFVGETQTLTSTVEPSTATDKTVTWSSSNPAVATVSATGVVSAKAKGEAVITATAKDGSGVKAECKVKVNPVLVTSIELSQDTWGAVVGESIQLRVSKVLPDNATDKSVTWSSSNTEVATVSASGLVKAVGTGDAFITATAKDGSDAKATCAVNIVTNEIDPTAVKLDRTTWSGKVGDGVKLTATVEPADATNKAVTWESSNENVATVDEKGNIRALSVGKATITATSEEKPELSATCAVEVLPTPVTGIILSATEWSGEVGAKTKLTAEVQPSDATNKAVNWTVDDPTIATVDTEGNITAKKVGETVVIATAADGSGVKAECKVTVKPTLVTSITLAPDSWSAVVGDKMTITAAVAPAAATNKAVTWSVKNTDVASVDAEGNVTAKAAGETVVIATAADGSGVTAECPVTVSAKVIKATGLSLSAAEWHGEVDKTVQLTASFTPADVTNKTLKWESSAPEFATVDAKGLVTAVSVGNAIIKATTTDGSNLSASCAVTVDPTPVSSITLTPAEWTAKVGDKTQLSAAVAPATATNQDIKWESSDTKVATVDAAGNVRAVGVGPAVITATAADGSGVKATCKVTVNPILVTSIELSNDTWGGVVGESVTLSAAVTPDNATNKAVNWASDNEAVATVDAAGNVTAVAAGAAVITAAAADGSGAKAECHVTVSAKVVQATSVALSATDWSGKVDETLTLKATVLPADATNKAVTWKSSDAEVATVDAKGVVTAHSVGKATITATTADGSDLSASCAVTVVPTPVETITLSAATWSGTVGSKTKLTATVEPEGATNKDVTWTSSDAKVATVDASGNVTAVKVGSATITAAAADGSGVKAECKVTVTPVLVKAIELSDDTWGGVVGESFKLSATVTPANATNKEIDWSSSDASVATVDAEGNVKAVAVGEAIVTATAHDGSGVKATCHVTVSAKIIKVSSITVSATEWSGKAGESVQLAATIQPSDATNKAVKWTSSDTDVATVDTKGKVTAVSVGEAVITVTTADGSNLSASCKVTVVPTLVESITLSAATWSGVVGDKTQLTATVEPDDATDKAVKWSTSDASVATVDAAGNVTAVKVGAATIIATAADGSGVKAECKVTVKPVLVKTIELSEDTWGGVVGESVQLTATVGPANATNKAVTWSSSDATIASVDAEGNVKAVAVGEATITATAADGSGVKATCHVTIAAKIIKVSSITVSAAEWSGKAGEGVQLTATVAPADATNKAVKWSSSDTSVATVDAKGKVTAVKVGEATITVTTADGSNLSASCKVTVIPTPVETITLSAATWSGVVGDKIQLTATVEPDDATDKAVTWATSDATVATVDTDGYVTAVKVGSATITATASDGSGVKATCKVTVKPVLVKAIELSEYTWGGVVGESFKLTATVTPANATNKAITWATSDAAIATVDADGNVKAVAVGEAVITVTAADGSGVKAECHVTVAANIIKATAISISAAEWSGKAGESVQLTATVTPADATNKAVKWSSSDPEVATVDSKGKVTAVKVGTTTITVTTADGTNLSAFCKVTVIPTPVETITLSATAWSGIVGDITQLTATVTPDDATDKAVVWSSSDASVATVDTEGNVTAVKVGSATITATAVDGSGVKATCKVTVKPVLAESLTVDPDSWNGEVGETFTIVATVWPENTTDKSLAWTSSDETVAKVDATGFVTTVGEGTCVITASTLDGSGLTAQCTVVTSLAGISDVLADTADTADVYTTSGLLIKRDCSLDDLRQLTPGFYILRQGATVKKVYLSPTR